MQMSKYTVSIAVSKSKRIRSYPVVRAVSARIISIAFNRMGATNLKNQFRGGRSPTALRTILRACA
jgi:hypothetical protein